MLVHAVPFDFTDQRFCPLAQSGTANLRHGLTFPHGLMFHDAIVGLVLFKQREQLTVGVAFFRHVHLTLSIMTKSSA